MAFSGSFWGIAITRKGFTCCLLLFAALAFVSVSVSPLRAADYGRVGVGPRDWAYYRVTRTWSTSAGESADSHYMSIQIMDVVGTTVAFNESDFDLGGEVSKVQLLTIDISTGSLSNSSFVLGDSMPLLVAAGLACGDPFYSELTVTINQTFWHEFAGGNRFCNYFVIYPKDSSVWEWGYYWDQATGLMIRQFNSTFAWTPSASYGMLRCDIELMSTSLWPSGKQVSAFDVTILFIFGVGIPLVLLGVVFVVIFKQTSHLPAFRPSEEETGMVTTDHVKRCDRCGAILRENVSYCTKCSEQILSEGLSRKPGTALRSMPHARPKEGLIGQKCMVCRLPLTTEEELVRCPHCMNIAHRAHMLEWLHIKGTCPVCGEHVEHSSLETL